MLEPEQNMKALLEHFTQMGPAGCGVAVYRGEQELFRHCAGFADLEARIPMHSSTIVRLYSNTKVFTNAAVLTLYEQGKFLLNDPIERYLPEWAAPKVGFFTGNGVAKVRPAVAPIRIKDLMTMSSGLTYGSGIAGGEYSMTHMEIQKTLDGLEAGGGYTTREFSRSMAQVPLLFDPGSSWSYGYSHDILGALIEEVSGMSFGEYLKHMVLDPLDLEDTFFFLPETKKNRLAKQYFEPDENGTLRENDGALMRYDAAHKFESGGGGLLSTLDDFSRFAIMMANGGTFEGARVLSRKTIDLMRQNHLGPQQLKAFHATHDNGWEFLKGYGYGLGVRTMMDRPEAGSNGSHGEFAWAGAAGTYMLADPEENFSVAYVQQVLPNPFEGYCHPRIRAVAYSFLE